MTERETVLPGVESKFNDGHPVPVGLIQVEVVSMDVGEFDGKETPFAMLRVRMYAKDGRLMYDVGPDKVFVTGKYKLNLP